MSSINALASSCRACLQKSLGSYFEMSNQCHFSSDDQNFSDVFMFCTQLKVQVNDEFPQRLCVLCVQDLQKTYQFLQRVLESNRKLIDLKECFNRNKEFLDNSEDYIKDPFENATDNEDTSDTDIKSKIIQQNEDMDYNSNSFDNADNTIEYSQVNAALITPRFRDNSDKNDGNFINSVKSQIFPEGRLKCEICHKTYFTNVGLQAHMDIHIPGSRTISKTALNVLNYKIKNNKTKANSCNDKISDDQNIKLMKSESKAKLPKPKKMFPCEVCGKLMISASKLRYHMVMHTGEKDYLCTVCPKAYSTIYALKHHMRTHTGERPYECKFCGDRFLRPTTLKSHMRRHTGERPYGCDICGKRFIQHSSMATHMKLNHMDKTIPCPYCEKKYARQTDLNTHLLSHSGDKPFGCLICPSRFTRQSNLNKHMNQHHSNVNSGDKRYKNNTRNEAPKDEFMKQSCENIDISTRCVFERPSCSSNLN